MKNLSKKELEKLSKDIRNYIIDVTSRKGGHLSSNLGVVELTIVLHLIFNTPTDKLLFDVSHQTYTHKILTGRVDKFETLREFNGLSGFASLEESEYDCFSAGHAGTSISAAIGMAISRDLKNENNHIVAVIGDASVSNGMALEAINHLGTIDNKVIIILNDNNMSISKPTGAISKMLIKIQESSAYNSTKKRYIYLFSKTPILKYFYRFTKKVKDTIKHLFLPNTIFESMNLDYLGPIDGHNFKDLKKALSIAKESSKSIVIHIKTKKGKGYSFAEDDLEGKWHGIASFDKITGNTTDLSDKNYIGFSEAFSNILETEMNNNEDLLVMTPAMIKGSKLEKIFQKFPLRSFDFGIAEEHFVTAATGIGLNKKIPVMAIYSTFLQKRVRSNNT